MGPWQPAILVVYMLFSIHSLHLAISITIYFFPLHLHGPKQNEHGVGLGPMTWDMLVSHVYLLLVTW